MSILIKGMKMPTHCAMCGFHGAKGNPMIYQHFCKVTGVSILNPFKGRLDDCPLVPVPPHGRLIDVDELKKESQYSYLIDDDIIFESDIDYIPTVIPAEPSKEET